MTFIETDYTAVRYFFGCQSHKKIWKGSDNCFYLFDIPYHDMKNSPEIEEGVNLDNTQTRQLVVFCRDGFQEVLSVVVVHAADIIKNETTNL